MNFDDWAPLRLVDSDLLSRVCLAYVFGRTGYEALFVTKEDEVFACGMNVFGCLGLENTEHQVKPVRVPNLSNKRVTGFAATVFDDGTFVCAYTSTGAVYYWGKNFSSNLTQIPTLLPKFGHFGRKASKVVCGRAFCLILTTAGEIFSFGNNYYGQLGNGSTNNLSEPTQVRGDLEGKIVNQIACGSYFSTCVLDNGEVYTWGTNSHRQLGCDNHSYLMSPTRVSELKGAVIKKITCGGSYVLAINEVGELFSWGCNEEGSLGLGDTTNRHQPTKITTIGRVIKIAAVEDDATSAAMTENLQVYMWGTCGGLHLKVPTKTKYDNLYDVFAYFSKTRMMHKPLKRHLQLESVGESIKNAFGNAATSDLTIVVDDKEIFVHQVILKLRSTYFNVLLQEQWIKEDDNQSQHCNQAEKPYEATNAIERRNKEADYGAAVERRLPRRSPSHSRANQGSQPSISGYHGYSHEPVSKSMRIKINQNYDGIYAYLQYIYTDNLKATPEVALELLYIANEYHDLVLKKLCETFIRHGITVENVANLYELALKLDCEKVAKYCMSFAGNHVGEVIHTPGFNKWDSDTAKNFIRECNKRKLFRC